MIFKSLFITKKFDDHVREKNIEDTFYRFINLELKENELKDFQKYLCDLIEEALAGLEKFPKENESALDNAKSISDLIDEETFRCGSIYYLKVNKNDCFYIIGDLHGDKNAFVAFFEKIQFLKNHKKDIKLIFLGDYIDRGLFGLNILTSLIFLKINFNEQIFLLRGNHEIWEENNGEIVSTALGDNMFLDFWKNYFERSTLAKIKEFFDKLPVIVILSNGIVLAHGGIPRPKEGSYNYVENLKSLNEKDRLFEIMWSRPEDKDDVIITYSSPQFSFAKRQFNEFMNHIGGKIMIRAHDPDGFKEFYDGKLISVFSTGGEGNETAYDLYKLTNPCYLQIFHEKICIYSIFPLKSLTTGG
jgi:hypothetical protein